MRNAYQQAVGDAHEMFTQAADRFADVVEGLQADGRRYARQELDATRSELRKGILELPQETAESAAQMRRVIVDQIEALAELNRIVARHGRGLDTVDPTTTRRIETTEVSGRRGAPQETTFANGPRIEPAPRPRNDLSGMTPPAMPPRRAESPSLSPAQTGQRAGWLTDLLGRADDEPPAREPPSREPPSREPPREPAPEVARGDDRATRRGIDSLDSLAVDIARMIDHDAAADLWDRYHRGERNVFTRKLYTMQGQRAFDEIRKKYRSERDFMQTVDRYIVEFERLLEEVSRDDRGQVVARTYLTSETGKVYTMLAHAAGRFDWTFYGDGKRETGAPCARPFCFYAERPSVRCHGFTLNNLQQAKLNILDLLRSYSAELDLAAPHHRLRTMPGTLPPSLSVRVERWPIAGAFTISRGAKTEATVVVAELVDRKFRGRGECVPYARYGETVEGVVQAIEAMRGAIAEGLDRDALQQAMPAGAARNALDCALWDLAAKQAGQPAHTLAGLANPKPLITAHTISLGTPAAMAASAEAAADRPLLKVKLGGGDDPARIAAVRRAAPRCELIVDANEGWTQDDLATNLAACADVGVTLVEQPLPADRDEPLARLDHLCPLCADESVHGRSSLAALIGKYDAVNIKLDKTGGLTEALLLADDAERLGFSLMVGCMVATSLAMAPAVLLAQRARIVDLDGPLLLARDRPGCSRYEGSFVHPPTAALWPGPSALPAMDRAIDRAAGLARTSSAGGISEETVITWRAILSAIAAVSFCAPIVRVAMAQSYPARPVKIIVPFAPGGVDVTARVVADRLSSVLGQLFVVENRAGGAGGSIGAKAVAMAEPDGYTLLFSTPGPVTISPAVNRNVDYDTRNFAAVAIVSNSPLMLVINPALPVNSVQELIAYAKANPGKVHFLLVAGIWHAAASFGRALESEDRRLLHARSLSWLVAGNNRSDRRPGADVFRQCAEPAAIRTGWHPPSNRLDE